MAVHGGRQDRAGQTWVGMAGHGGAQWSQQVGLVEPQFISTMGSCHCSVTMIFHTGWSAHRGPPLPPLAAPGTPRLQRRPDVLVVFAPHPLQQRKRGLQLGAGCLDAVWRALVQEACILSAARGRVRLRGGTGAAKGWQASSKGGISACCANQ